MAWNGVPIVSDDLVWASEAAAARHASLTNVRAVADGWLKSIGLVMAVFTTAAFIKGPEALKDIPTGTYTFEFWFIKFDYVPQAAVVALVILTAIALASAITFASFASQGSPHWSSLVTGQSFKATSQAATKASIKYLGWSRVATLIAVLFVTVGMTIAWGSQIPKASTPVSISAIVMSSDTAVCGSLSTDGVGAVSVKPANGEATRVQPGSSLTIVAACPSSK